MICYRVIVKRLRTFVAVMCLGQVVLLNAQPLSPPPPSLCAAVPPGIVSCWRGADNVLDSVGSNTGAAVGSLAFGSGNVGRGFLFDGNEAYVRVAASSTLNVGAGS